MKGAVPAPTHRSCAAAEDLRELQISCPQVLPRCFNDGPLGDPPPLAHRVRILFIGGRPGPPAAATGQQLADTVTSSASPAWDSLMPVAPTPMRPDAELPGWSSRRGAWDRPGTAGADTPKTGPARGLQAPPGTKRRFSERGLPQRRQTPMAPEHKIEERRSSNTPPRSPGPQRNSWRPDKRFAGLLRDRSRSARTAPRRSSCSASQPEKRLVWASGGSRLQPAPAASSSSAAAAPCRPIKSGLPGIWAPGAGRACHSSDSGCATSRTGERGRPPRPFSGLVLPVRPVLLSRDQPPHRIAVGPLSGGPLPLRSARSGFMTRPCDASARRVSGCAGGCVPGGPGFGRHGPPGPDGICVARRARSAPGGARPSLGAGAGGPAGGSGRLSGRGAGRR